MPVSNPWADKSGHRFKQYLAEFEAEGAGDQSEFLALRMMCLTDLGFLVRDIFGLAELRDRKTGRKRWFPPIHEPFCEHLQKDENGLYHLSRGMMKSGIAVIWVIQKLLQDPASVRIALWSQTAELVQRELGQIKDGLQNETLMELFPDILIPREKWEVDNADSLTLYRNIPGEERPSIKLKENQIEVFGLGKTATGRHYDYHLYDDPIDDRNVTTAEQIDKVRQWWSAVQAIKEPSAIEKIIGTPWHQMDIYAEIRQQNLFSDDEIFIRPACDEDAEQVFYPFFTKTWLKQQKRIMGPQLFAAQYALQTRPREDQMFLHPYPTYETKDLPKDRHYYITVDPSTGRSKRHDKTGICVACVDAQSPRSLFFIEADSFVLQAEALADKIISLSQKYSPRRIGVEKNLLFEGLESLLRYKARERNILQPELWPISQGGGAGAPSKADKLNRTIGALIRDHRAYFTAGMVKLFNQMDEYNPNSQKNDDDIIDAAGMMVQTVPHFAPSHWFGTGPDDSAWTTVGDWDALFFPKKKGSIRDRVFAH